MDTLPTIRAPAYLARFECLGAACEDNCCAGWQNIDVDADTYRRYRGVEHPELSAALRRHVRPNPDPAAGPDELALIGVPDGGCCPFFTAGRLCAIQGGLGEALLPAGCDTFPRQATLIGGLVEVAGRFSCPEIVRLALLTPDALDLAEVEPDRRLSERGRYWVEAPWSDEPPPTDPRRHYHRLRRLIAELLQRDEVSLEARLQALGRALATLSELPELEAAAVESAFAAAAARLADLQWQIDATSFGNGGPVPLLVQRLRPWVAMADVPPRYRACLDRLRDGLGLPAEPATPLGPRVAEAYAAALPSFRAYVRARPCALEHFVLNQLPLSTFPYHPRHSFFEEYAVFACRYGLLKLQLVAAAAAEGALTDALVVETVQAFDKYADGPDYWRRTLDLLRREHALTPVALAALILD